MDQAQSNIIYSDAFKRWFGDWEKQPYTASKAVNNDGTPMVLYHGSMKEFDTFDRRHIRKKTDGLKGFYFSPRQDVGKYYSFDAEPRAFYLNIRKPYIDYRPRTSNVFPIDLKELYANYDGVIAVSGNNEVIEMVIFQSNQAKSVNATEFSKSKNVNEALVKEDLGVKFADMKDWRKELMDSLPDPIVLYHNCTQPQLDDIINTGEIDCHQKHSEGHWDMVWFTLNPEAWSRQCKLSIRVPKSRFKEFGFYFANQSDVCIDYKNVPINDFDFKIDVVNGMDYDTIMQNLANEEDEKTWQYTYNHVMNDAQRDWPTLGVGNWFIEELYGDNGEESFNESLDHMIAYLIQEELKKNRKPI